MKTAQVVLINEQGLILGVSRKDDHTNFGLAGGKMEECDNNDPMATAIRECKEETGLDITNLRLVFAIHKSGNMGFTFLADYTGEINHNEPHVVRWVPFQLLINGSFGRYNKMVSESLIDMGVKFQIDIDEAEMSEEVMVFVNDYFDGEIEFGGIKKEHSYFDSVSYEVYFNEGEDDDFEESFDAPIKFAKGLYKIGLKYGVRLRLTSHYTSK